MRAALLVLLIAVAGVFAPVTADARWTQVRSEHFIFIGDASEGQIRRIAQKLEQFREVLLRALPNATAASPVPTVVLVFATDRSLQPVAPLFNGRPIEVAGYFQGGEDLNYIAVDAEYIDPALRAIFHEYSHFLVTNSIGQLPPWASEGLAEVYEMVMERDGGKKAVVGAPPQEHIDLLRASTLIPIRELPAITQQSSVYNEGNRRSVFYAQSWALVHYLTFGNPERARQFRQFLARVATGAAPAAAFTEAFGDGTAIDRELLDYVRAYLFPAIVFDFGEKVAAQTVQKGQTLGDAEAAIYLADLQGRVGRLEESRTRLAAVLKQNPNAARAHAALGMQEFRANQLDKALPLLERAAALGASDGWVQNAYGRALIARLGTGDDSAAAVERARTVLTRAVELDPESPFAAAMLGYVELILDSDPTRAVPLLERAVKLAPSREQYRLFLAQAYLRQREFTKASNQLGPLVASARSPEIREQARDLLGRLVTMQQRAAAPAAGAAAAAAPAAPPTAEQLASLAALSRSAESTAAPSDAARAPSRPGPMVRLDLRPVGAGEIRVRGRFSAVECSAGGIVLVVQTDAGPLRLRAKQLSEVDFISYRTDTPGRVECGVLSASQPVLATYRSAPQGAGASSTAGDAAAIELVPDDYVLR